MSQLTLSPDVALLFIAIGSLAICAEFLRPGMVIPGVLGSVSVLFGIAALRHIRWQGAVISLIAFILLALESKYPSRYVLTLLGAATLPLGAIEMHPGIHPWVAFLTMAPLALLAGYLFRLAVRARCNKSP